MKILFFLKKKKQKKNLIASVALLYAVTADQTMVFARGSAGYTKDLTLADKKFYEQG